MIIFMAFLCVGRVLYNLGELLVLLEPVKQFL